MKNTTLLAAAVALAIGLGIGWIAAPKMRPMQMDHDMGRMMDMSKPKGDQGASSLAFAMANSVMHTGMDIVFTGDADVDFAKGMIPHHEGAVEMAKIVLRHGKDADLRKLAQGIIAAQEAEIKFMNDWLAKNAQ